MMKTFWRLDLESAKTELSVSDREIISLQGRVNSQGKVAHATKFCAVAPNMYFRGRGRGGVLISPFWRLQFRNGSSFFVFRKISEALLIAMSD
jgi:hypothetical protein